MDANSAVAERQAAPRSGSVLFTAYVLVLLVITVPPLWVALLVLPAGRWPDRVLKGCIRLVVRASGCRLSVTGVEHLGTGGSAMLVANHSSYIDSVVLMAALPIDCRFVANHRLMSVPLISTAIRQTRYLVVDRTAMRARRACLLAIVDTLQHGTSVLVFPEGTISRGPDLLPFRAGAFRAAVETGRPVVPISLRGTRDILPYRSWLLRQGTIVVTIHAPIAVSRGARPEIVRARDCARHEIVSGLRRREDLGRLGAPGAGKHARVPRS